MKRKWFWVLLLVLAADGLILFWWWQERRDRSHDQVIIHAARRYGMDPALVKAVVWRESQFKAKAKGRAGEIGLMQVGASAAQEWAEAEKIVFFRHQHLFDPKKNTLAGTWYLAKMLEHFQHTDDPLPYGLAAYNAGRSNVLRWNTGAAETNSAVFIEQIGFPSTKAYVRTVLERYEEYRGQFP